MDLGYRHTRTGGCQGCFATIWRRLSSLNALTEDACKLWIPLGSDSDKLLKESLLNIS